MKKLIKNNTTECIWPYILRILKDGNKHAYVIREEIRRRFGFKIGNMTAYVVLYSLKKKGYVEQKTIGRKKVYSITKNGEKLLEDAIKFYRRQLLILS
ncbi:MAG: PadR family transcriptional regulator [Candidatus Aenigmarchaeota archaeon]|nr:PadR family transcriptional regulator [Candidatus Aenigmarchaeota archaeon]